MDQNFVALDLETANADLRSICQIGIAEFRDGILIEEWETLVNPLDWFDPVNVGIHGITEEAVTEAPDFSSIAPRLAAKIRGRIVVTHTHFDRSALTQAFEAVETEFPEIRWLDSARVAGGHGPSLPAKDMDLETFPNFWNTSTKLTMHFRTPKRRATSLCPRVGTLD